LALSLFLIESPAALSSVKVEPFQRSTERPQVTVTLQGTPQSHVKIEIYKLHFYSGKGKRVVFTRFTDSKGRATLPKLIPDQYRVVASIKPDLEANLYLEFIPEDPEQAARFVMELQPPSYAIEKSPIATRISEFRGVVRNEAGDPIPRASIDVVQLRTQAQNHTTRLHADAQGRFAAKLPDGDYLAFFDVPGLKERAIPLTLSKAEGGGELQVVLQIMPIFSGVTE